MKNKKNKKAKLNLEILELEAKKAPAYQNLCAATGGTTYDNGQPVTGAEC